MSEPQLMIKIEGGAMGKEGFSWGHYSKEARAWFEQHVGEVFPGVRAGMNHYKLENGFFLHIYDGSERKTDQSPRILTSTEQAIQSVILFLIEQASARSLDKWSGVHFVKNEMFPVGAYRIHRMHFIPNALDMNGTNAIIAELTAPYPFVEWDASSLWLTIHIQ